MDSGMHISHLEDIKQFRLYLQFETISDEQAVSAMDDMIASFVCLADS